MPGAGALLAAVATASGVTPEIAGKPHDPMAALMKSRFGFEDGDGSVVMIGDQPRTDGRLAQRLAIPFGLVDSGVTPAGADDFDVPVAVRCPGLRHPGPRRASGDCVGNHVLSADGYAR